MGTTDFGQDEVESRDCSARQMLELHSRVVDLIARGARANPDGNALVYLRAVDDHTPVGMTYRQLMGAISATSSWLRSLGVGANDVVSIMAPPCPATFVAIWSAMATAVANPLNLLFSRDALVAQLKAVRAKILLVPPPGAPGGLYEKTEGLLEEVPSLEHIVAIPIDGRVAFDQHEIVPDTDWSRLIGAATDVNEADRVAALYPTGGTTGLPKVARLTNRNMVASGIASFLAIDYRSDDRVLVALPLFHVGGAFVMSLAALAGGAAVYIPTATGFRNPAVTNSFWRLIQEHRITVTALVPTSLGAVATVPRNGASAASLRFVGTGASPCPAETERQFLAIWGGDAIRQVYGMTEFAGAIAQLPFDKMPERGSVGLPVALAEVAIILADGKLDTTGYAAGELVVRGPQSFPGYVHASQTKDAFHEGWLRTGDLCRIDQSGQIHIAGRIKDLIIRGGHNIDPLMIEEAAMEFPGVFAAAAVGRPDSYAGEVPMLFVAAVPGKQVQLDELKSFIETRISERPALPKAIEILPEMPTTLVGKIFKPRLREIAAEREAEAIAARVAPQASITIKAATDPARGLVLKVNVSGTDHSAVTALQTALAQLPLTSEVIHEH